MKASPVRRGNTLPGLFRGLWDANFFNLPEGDMLAPPAMNVIEKPDEFVVDMSVPGFDKNDIDATVDKNILRICAQNKSEKDEKDSKDKIIRQEFVASSFERRFSLPENIDTAKISARQNNGVRKTVANVRAPARTGSFLRRGCGGGTFFQKSSLPRASPAPCRRIPTPFPPRGALAAGARERGQKLRPILAWRACSLKTRLNS